MKKLGFTLAEVLITMAIIGVIAAVTLPTLNVNVTENAAVTKYKKAMASISSIGSIIAANDRMDFSDLATGAVATADNAGYDNGQLRRQVWAVFDKYGRLDRNHTTGATAIGGQCNTATQIIFFKDNTALCYNARGENNFITGWIDINGTKAPNQAFSCTDATCNNRTVGDQLAVTLAGEDAYPGHLTAFNRANDTATFPEADTNTFAARWAFEK